MLTMLEEVVLLAVDEKNGQLRSTREFGAAYALVAVGVVLIYKCTRVLSLAQGEIGAFGFFLGLRWAARGVPGLGWHPPRFATLLIAVFVGALQLSRFLLVSFLVPFLAHRIRRLPKDVKDAHPPGATRPEVEDKALDN